MGTTSRRDLLGAAAALPLAAAPVVAHTATAAADAGLQTLAHTLMQQTMTVLAIEAEGEFLPDGITDASDDQEQRLRDAMDVWQETAKRIADTPARSTADLRAKVEAVGHVFLCLGSTPEPRTCFGINCDPIENRMARALRHEVLGVRA